MTESLSVPTATSFRDIAVDVLDARRKTLNGQLAPKNKKVSFTHLIGWAIVQAAREFPVMTHSFHEYEGKPHRLDPQNVSLGLAVDVEKKDGTRALVVPVIKHAEKMDFATFHATYEALVDKARTNKLMPDDFAGGSITLTNPGTIGTIASVPRLMKGQGSIIATGAIRSIGPAKVMTMTSTYDHRVIQGAESGMFLRLLDSLLQGEEDFYGKVMEAAEAIGESRSRESVSLPCARTATAPRSLRLPTAPASHFRAVARRSPPRRGGHVPRQSLPQLRPPVRPAGPAGFRAPRRPGPGPRPPGPHAGCPGPDSLRRTAHHMSPAPPSPKRCHS